MSRSSSLVFVARSVGSVLSDEQIIRSEGYCLMCVCVCVCVCVCDLETITMRRPKPELCCCATEDKQINPLNPELNPICYLLALLGAQHFLHVSRIRVKLLTFRLLMSYIYIHGAPILDISRSHTTTQHSR